MAIKEFIRIFLESTPIIRRVWRWFLEHNMEVTTKAHFEDMPPYVISAPDLIKGTCGRVHALLDMQLINHRTDRPERIIGCWAELRKRHLYFWRQKLATIPVEVVHSNSLKQDAPIDNIFLEQMSKPQTHLIKINGKIENVEMPKRSELVLVFRMVGPMKKYVHKLTDVLHNPTV